MTRITVTARATSVSSAGASERRVRNRELRVATSPENTRYPTATAFSAAMRTAPAAMSFAIFAIGSNDVDATSTVASTAVFTSSATSTNVIASRSTASSSFVAPNPTAATRTATATAKWIQRFRCVRTAWTIPRWRS